MRRFSVRPGLTCLWQIRGRSALGFDEWITLDLHYIDQWSLALDLLILAAHGSRPCFAAPARANVNLASPEWTGGT